MVVCYTDDVVLGDTFEEHIENLAKVFQIMREFKVKLNPKKCQFATQELTILGHKLTPQGLVPDPGKFQSITEIPPSASRSKMITNSSYFHYSTNRFIYPNFKVNIPMIACGISVNRKHHRKLIMHTSGKRWTQTSKITLKPAKFAKRHNQQTAKNKANCNQSNPPPIFTMWSLDAKGPLLETKAGNKYVLVMTKFATRYLVAHPTDFIKLIILRNWCPKYILTDSGTSFNNEMITELFSDLQIQKLRMTAYSPQTNGLTEAMNKILAQHLTMHAHDSPHQWDKLPQRLPNALLPITKAEATTTDVNLPAQHLSTNYCLSHVVQKHRSDSHISASPDAANKISVPYTLPTGDAATGCRPETDLENKISYSSEPVEELTLWEIQHLYLHPLTIWKVCKKCRCDWNDMLDVLSVATESEDVVARLWHVSVTFVSCLTGCLFHWQRLAADALATTRDVRLGAESPRITDVRLHIHTHVQWVCERVQIQVSCSPRSTEELLFGCGPVACFSLQAGWLRRPAADQWPTLAAAKLKEQGKAARQLPEAFRTSQLPSRSTPSLKFEHYRLGSPSPLHLPSLIITLVSILGSAHQALVRVHAGSCVFTDHSINRQNQNLGELWFPALFPPLSCSRRTTYILAEVVMSLSKQHEKRRPTQSLTSSVKCLGLLAKFCPQSHLLESSRSGLHTPSTCLPLLPPPIVRLSIHLPLPCQATGCRELGASHVYTWKREEATLQREFYQRKQEPDLTCHMSNVINASHTTKYPVTSIKPSAAKTKWSSALTWYLATPQQDLDCINFRCPQLYLAELVSSPYMAEWQPVWHSCTLPLCADWFRREGVESFTPPAVEAYPSPSCPLKSHHWGNDVTCNFAEKQPWVSKLLPLSKQRVPPTITFKPPCHHPTKRWQQRRSTAQPLSSSGLSKTYQSSTNSSADDAFPTTAAEKSSLTLDTCCQESPHPKRTPHVVPRVTSGLQATIRVQLFSQLLNCQLSSAPQANRHFNLSCTYTKSVEHQVCVEVGGSMVRHVSILKGIKHVV
ncbi:hypothetical protein PR048_029820 [Dryococelus australis]|uniref:Integrase catalytic domain-containing protein n=1 Tax=Dryococelus australis TaxID=614101 RepID=A0ABQ9GB50_9NEOP|nr:hypothetical protein PR048_029820 [Dryococelus australis]